MRYRSLALFLSLAALCRPTTLSGKEPLPDSRVAELVTSQAPLSTEDQAALDAAVDGVVAKVRALFLASGSTAKDFDPVIQQLAIMLPEGTRYNRPQPTPPSLLRLAEAQNFAKIYQEYLFAQENDDFVKAAQKLDVLGQLEEQNASTVPRSTLMALINAARDTAARDQQMKFDKMAARLAAVVDKATSGADFDPLLAELQTATGQVGDFQNGRQNLNQLRHFASQWQDYFLARDSNPSAAAGILRQLAAEGVNYPAPIRDRIRALNPASAVESPVGYGGAPSPRPTPTPVPLPDPKGLTIDTMSEYRDKLNPNRLGSSATGETNFTEMTLRGLIEARNALSLGNFQPAIASNPSTYEGCGAYAAPLLHIRETMNFQALQAEFADAQLQPTPGESSRKFSRRIVQAYLDAENWARAVDALNALNLIERTMDGYVDVNTLRNFQVGLHQEAAGEYRAAVMTYLGCLAGTGSFTPVAALARHLQAIKTAHPQEYAEAHVDQANDEHVMAIALAAAQNALRLHDLRERNAAQAGGAMGVPVPGSAAPLPRRSLSATGAVGPGPTPTP